MAPASNSMSSSMLGRLVERSFRGFQVVVVVVLVQVVPVAKQKFDVIKYKGSNKESMVDVAVQVGNVQARGTER